MSLAKKCDICGKLYEEYNVLEDSKKVNGIMFLNIDCHMKYYSGKAIDCCASCMKSIRSHIETLKYPVCQERNE